MGADLAALGTFPKTEKGSKVYYVNRLRFGFPVKKYGEDGKPVQRTNQATGLPITNGRGEPEYYEEAVMFNQWQPRFTDLGYWCVYEVKKETPKHIAETLKRMANSSKSQIMSEKKFIEHTNPALARHLDETRELSEEHKMLQDDVEKARNEKSKLLNEIDRLKKKAG